MRTNIDLKFPYAFPKAGREPYRIEWFGDVTHTSRSGGHTPMVQIVLSRWQPDDPEHANSFSSIALPIAYLRMFRIGDLWANGKPYGTDDSSIIESFHELEISDETVTVAPAGLPINMGNGHSLYPLPFSTFEAHKGHTGAFCARVKVADNITLIVPCLELIRFYFGASGAFLSRIFSGALTGDKLYTAARINPESGIARLELSPGLPGYAASTIGRIAFDSFARKALKWIVNSGVSSAANGNRFYPRSTFPFSGRTNLTARGRWIEQQGHKVFLAEQLVQCTHPFPFQRLFYTSHLSAAPFRHSNPPPSTDQEASAPDHQPNTVLSEGMTSSILQPVALQANDIDFPFPDLIHKPVRRIKANNPPVPTQASDSSSIGSGESSVSGDIRAAEITTEPLEEDFIEALPNTLEILSNALIEHSEGLGGRLQLLNPIKNGFAGDVPFVRADTVVMNGNPTLEKIWLACLKQGLGANSKSLLMLVKEADFESGDTNDDDQFTLLPYDSDDDPDGKNISRPIDSFLAMKPSRGEQRDDPEEYIGQLSNLSSIWAYFTEVLGRNY